MHHVSRALIVALLVCTLVGPAPAVATAATCDTPQSTPGVGLISEAAGVLSSMYVDALSESSLLVAAAEATRGEVARQGPVGAVPDPPKSLGGDNAAAEASFAAYYCQLWDVARDGTDPTTTAYAGIRAMTSSVNENHTRFFTPEMYQAHLASI